MAVKVAEYLGQRTDGPNDIRPEKVSKGRKPEIPCPFRNALCIKAKSGNKPVCSVRDPQTQEIWITCEHRLCATSPKDSDLSEHQAGILHRVAKEVYGEDIPLADVLVKREVPIPVTKEQNYSADYVMWRRNPRITSPFNPDRALVLEMQGGGETTNTGHLTRHVDNWENQEHPANDLLAQEVASVSSLVTNAWRRQQEQFLVKGNVAMLTGGKMVFCVSTKLYDYLMGRFKEGILDDLRQANWSLALLVFCEDTEGTPAACAPDSIPLKIDPDKSLFTNYGAFVQALTNQSVACTEVFTGEYRCLDNSTVEISSDS